MVMKLVGVVKRHNMLDLKYGETIEDTEPFTLTITSQYVAQQTSKAMPLAGIDLTAYLMMNASKLRATAEDCKARGLASEVLT
jgi:hypothetical protein